MTTTLQKYPFPTPSTGVMRNVHPRELSLNGLTYAKNWIRRNGIFHTRDGLAMFSPQMDTVSAANELILGMYQYDYQKDGVYQDGNDDPSKDTIVAVTNLDCYTHVPSATAWEKADEVLPDDVTSLVGPNIASGQAMDFTDKLSLSLGDVTWPTIATWIGATHYDNIRWLTIEIEITASGYLWRFKDDDGNTDQVVERGWGTVIPKTVELDDGSSPTGFGIFLQIDDSNFDEELAQFGGTYPYLIKYTARLWHGEQMSDTVIAGSRDNAEVMRAWDFGQETHVLIASPNHKIADLQLDVSGVPVVTGLGQASPKAATIALAGQRVVAGNVSFLDEVGFLTNATYNTDPQSTYQAHYPDGIVYSGTVLEDGHNKWYQEYLIRLADTPGAIVASMEMGTMMLAVYKTDAIFVLAVQTGTDPFRPEMRASGIQGPVGPKAVAAISDNLHVFLGRDGALYLFDGSPPRSMGPAIQEWLARDLDVDYAHRSHLAWDPEIRELRVWYPAKGHNGRVRCGLVVGFDEQNQPSWPIEYYTEVSKVGEAPPTFTADWDITCSLPAYVDAIAIPGEMLSFSGNSIEDLGTLTTRQRRVLVCNCVGGTSNYKPDILYESPTTGDTYSNGTAYPIRTSFRSGTTDFDMPDRMKVVTEVELLLDTGNVTGVSGRDKMTVKLWSGGQNTILQESYQVDVDTTTGDPYFAEFREEGRFFALEFAIQAMTRRNFGGAFAALKPRGRPR